MSYNAPFSTMNAAKHRQPMCPDCEKSLPNQVVFDKIEHIIRSMQDDQIGLNVKTAKSFMSKIPSVFTGMDLVTWLADFLKLEDQQEALHLANLIASHGYIFPIEDHMLAIRNDCTFYRFQTPCLWPSNNTEPENADYAVYLCKRTMQGKTRLELADYEAENLARLQKMFSRRWEFIFLQAESQAKVDKKRDKLERKVLDSQERAFWDVYRPVPGCVNTTEIDIKKTCRMSKSAKQCSGCQQVASASVGDQLPQLITDQSAAATPQSQPCSKPTSASVSSDTYSSPPPQPASISSPVDQQDKQAYKDAPAISDTKIVSTTQELCAAPVPLEPLSLVCNEQTQQTRFDKMLAAIGANQRPSHPHHHHHSYHHHHHHHHHHHPHAHHHHSHSGPHIHTHHHRQCTHHKYQRVDPRHCSESSLQQTRTTQKLSIPAESILTATMAASTAWTDSGESGSQKQELEKESTVEAKDATGLVNQFIGVLALQSQRALRRKSDCNQLMSGFEVSKVHTGTILDTIEKPQQRPTSACLESFPSAKDKDTQLIRKSSLNSTNAIKDASSSLGVETASSSTVKNEHSVLKESKSVFAGKTTSCLVDGEECTRASYSLAEMQSIDNLERELEALKMRLERRIDGVKMSKLTQSYLSYFRQWAEYDPFITQPIPSNPWISDSSELWDSERQTKDVHCRRVRRWAFSLKELLCDPAGREQFYRFLEKEFSAENLKFWDAVQELKRVRTCDVAQRVEVIWSEYLAQDANCPINIDSKSYETSKKNMAKNKNNRCIFDEAAVHVYQLMKNDSYPRYLRSDMYKEYKETSEKRRTNQVNFDVFKPQITTLKHKFNF